MSNGGMTDEAMYDMSLYEDYEDYDDYLSRLDGEGGEAKYMDEVDGSSQVPPVTEAELNCLLAREEWNWTQGVCPPHWDRISCWPPTAANTTAIIPCIKQLNGVLYDTSKNASLDCLPEGTWANKSDYSHCTPLNMGDDVLSQSSSYATSLSNIYFTGYSISLVALVVAFSIFVYFKEMRCLRNKIHANLFLTYILANTCWILTAIMQEANFKDSNIEFSWCVSLVFLRYFHLATFFWMFVEGLFLFVQVIATFAVESSKMKLRHYASIGWGLPLLIVVLWAVFTHNRATSAKPAGLQNASKAVEELIQPKCPFIEGSYLEWIYIGPVLLLLGTNTFFLISIFSVVVTKLRSTGRGGEADHQNWKAAKALLVIIPLLGITYLITILGPTNTSSISYIIFVHVRAVLLSTQGFAVTLPYCFLNTEVRGIITHNWNRWRAVRFVGRNYSRGQSARNSISLAGYYACDSNITNISTSRRNSILRPDNNGNSRRSSFFRLHTQNLSTGTPQHAMCETQLVTSVVLERGGSTSNRIIPVIEEESEQERQANAFIHITPATPSSPQSFPAKSIDSADEPCVTEKRRTFYESESSIINSNADPDPANGETSSSSSSGKRQRTSRLRASAQKSNGKRSVSASRTKNNGVSPQLSQSCSNFSRENCLVEATAGSKSDTELSSPTELPSSGDYRRQPANAHQVRIELHACDVKMSGDELVVTE